MLKVLEENWKKLNDPAKFLFRTSKEGEEGEEKTRVKVRFYRATYGCMRVEPIYANSYRDCPSSLIVPFSQEEASRNIQNGGV